jgi:hypothetical protein
MFDNQWMVFPQDFPSARFLVERKIKRVTLVQAEKTQPSEDLPTFFCDGRKLESKFWQRQKGTSARRRGLPFLGLRDSKRLGTEPWR